MLYPVELRGHSPAVAPRRSAEATVGVWRSRDQRHRFYTHGFYTDAQRTTRHTSLRLYNTLLRILISAGEASGEMYGAQLIEALRRAAAQNTAELRSARTGEAPVPTQANPYTSVSRPTLCNSALSGPGILMLRLTLLRCAAAGCIWRCDLCGRRSRF
jgi:hypothetical protein